MTELLHMLILDAWAGIIYQISTMLLISQKANTFFRMMLSTFLTGLMSERPKVGNSNTHETNTVRIYVLRDPVSSEDEGLSLQSIF